MASTSEPVIFRSRQSAPCRGLRVNGDPPGMRAPALGAVDAAARKGASQGKNAGATAGTWPAGRQVPDDVFKRSGRPVLSIEPDVSRKRHRNHMDPDFPRRSPRNGRKGIDPEPTGIVIRAKGLLTPPGR